MPEVAINTSRLFGEGSSVPEVAINTSRLVVEGRNEASMEDLEACTARPQGLMKRFKQGETYTKGARKLVDTQVEAGCKGAGEKFHDFYMLGRN